MATTLTPIETEPLALQLSPALELSEEQFFEICQLNRDLRLERTADGKVEIMPPTGGETGSENAILTHLVTAWALRDGTGRAFDSSTGFRLPNRAVRSPDASWVREDRLAALTPEQRRRFLPLCPDFVVELRSPSDRLETARAKLDEYMANGARLGWLLDAPGRRVHIYRPGSEVEALDDPDGVSGEPVLPGFTLDLRLVWGGGAG
jgi:Uma2 family endonuclease